MDLDAWDERAAILEFDEGMTQFQAETEAARRQNLPRWEFVNAIRERNSKRGRDIGQKALRDATGNVPTVQPHAAKQGRPMPKRDVRG